MQRSREDLTSRTPASATHEPTVSLELSTEDVEMLHRLRDAGLIRFDALARMDNQDPRLTDWTYDEVLRHFVAKQRLRARTTQGRDSTARCRIRYLKSLEEHEVVPVQLRPPDEDSWLDYVSYRQEEDGLAGTGLNQYRKALKSLLTALGLPHWESLDKPYAEQPPHWELPTDEVVRRFWTEPLHADAYLAATLAYVFHLGFYTGVRPPSELVALSLDDVSYDESKLVVTEIKKGGKRREITGLPDFVLTAHNAKSVRNYVEHWRPRVDTGESDALFLDANGERFQPIRLGWLLSKAGKGLWPKFTPYTMRRWHATRLLIESGFNVYVVAERLGDTVAVVERHYLDRARARAALKGLHQLPRLTGGRA